LPDKKVILPIAAAFVLLAIMWFAFRDNSADDPVSKPPPAPAARPVASAVAVDASKPMWHARFMAAEARGSAG